MWKLVVSREAGGHCGIREGGGYASSAVRADRDGDMIRSTPVRGDCNVYACGIYAVHA